MPDEQTPKKYYILWTNPTNNAWQDRIAFKTVEAAVESANRKRESDEERGMVRYTFQIVDTPPMSEETNVLYDSEIDGKNETKKQGG